MEFTIKQLAEILNGSIEGNPQAKVSKLSKIEEGQEGSVSFLSNPKYTSFVYSTKATAVIVSKDFKAEFPFSCSLIRVEDAYTAFATLLEAYNKIKLNKKGISPKAHLPENTKMGENIYIGEFVVVGDNVSFGDDSNIYPNTIIGDNVTIGNNTTIYAGAKIYSETIIGNNCTIHSGTVIGSDGFGFAPQSDNKYKKVAQIGNVIIEDNVEIGSNTTIDRATLGSTIIRKGVKLDNLIQIAHNVEIGENTVIAAQTGISGSTKIGKNCMIGGQVGIIGHIIIGNNVKIAAQSGIGGNVPDNSTLMGSPAFDIKDYRKSYVHFRNLQKITKRLDAIENKKNPDF